MNTNAQTVIGSCDICKRKFVARDQFIMNRILGFHKRKAHNIPGAWARDNRAKRDAALRRYYERTGQKPSTLRSIVAMRRTSSGTMDLSNRNLTNDERHQNKLERMRRWRAEKKMRTDGQTNPMAVPQQAKAAFHSECPCCHAKFWYTIPQQ